MFKENQDKQSEQTTAEQFDELYEGIPLLCLQNQKIPSDYVSPQQRRQREAMGEILSVHAIHSALDMVGQRPDGQSVLPMTLIDEDMQVMAHGTPDHIDEIERRKQSQVSHLWHIIPNRVMETVRQYMFRGVKQIES